MQVEKTKDGFKLVNEPMRVEGEAADKMAAEIEAAPTEESQRFQARARETYERVQGKISV
jgi:hypothetical protein